MKLKSLKRELKEFEHQFYDLQGRKPEKQDIASDKEIGKGKGDFKDKERRGA